MKSQQHERQTGTRRVAWVRPSQVPPIETDDTILERKGVVAPMQPDAPPFLLLGEDRFVQGAFPMHPHVGIETVTYVVEGTLEHEDSEGQTGVVHAGGVQWMTAGRGIEHREEPLHDKPVHGFQLWIDLPSELKRCAPRLQAAERHEHAVRHLPGGTLRVAAGTLHDVTGPIETLHPATMAVLDLEADAEVHLDVDPEQAMLLFARTGDVEVLGTAMPADHGAYLPPGAGAVRLRARAEAQVLCYGAVP